MSSLTNEHREEGDWLIVYRSADGTTLRLYGEARRPEREEHIRPATLSDAIDPLPLDTTRSPYGGRVD